MSLKDKIILGIDPVGRENTPSEGFIYVLYEFGDFQNNYAGAKIAKFNMSWLLLGKEIDKYVK